MLKDEDARYCYSRAQVLNVWMSFVICARMVELCVLCGTEPRLQKWIINGFPSFLFRKWHINRSISQRRVRRDCWTTRIRLFFCGVFQVSPFSFHTMLEKGLLGKCQTLLGILDHRLFCLKGYLHINACRMLKHKCQQCVFSLRTFWEKPKNSHLRTRIANTLIFLCVKMWKVMLTSLRPEVFLWRFSSRLYPETLNKGNWTFAWCHPQIISLFKPHCSFWTQEVVELSSRNSSPVAFL